MDCSIVITDQYYENNCYHVTMASEGKDLMISCQHFVDSHVLEASATQITHIRLIYVTHRFLQCACMHACMHAHMHFTFCKIMCVHMRKCIEIVL